MKTLYLWRNTAPLEIKVTHLSLQVQCTADKFTKYKLTVVVAIFDDKN